jgi:hypothetical protein
LRLVSRIKAIPAGEPIDAELILRCWNATHDESAHIVTARDAQRVHA